jgi:hypothetical protein
MKKLVKIIKNKFELKNMMEVQKKYIHNRVYKGRIRKRENLDDSVTFDINTRDVKANPVYELKKKEPAKRDIRLKKELTEQDIKDALDREVTRARGGNLHFTGYVDEAAEDFYERIDQLIPKAYYDKRNPINSDSSI